MSQPTTLRTVIEAVRRHVERATVGTGLQAHSMTVNLRFSMQSDDTGLVRSVLRTSEDEGDAPHSLKIDVALTGSEKGS